MKVFLPIFQNSEGGGLLFHSPIPIDHSPLDFHHWFPDIGVGYSEIYFLPKKYLIWQFHPTSAKN
jgi:hypothetical protein